MKAFEVCRLFEARYGKPRLGNKSNPLNEYLYILLSLRSTYWSFEKVYKNFKRKYPKWEDAYRADFSEIAETIIKACLSNQKLRYTKNTFRKIHNDFGRLSLSCLKNYKDERSEEYLIKLPDLGIKSARCNMMYSLDRDVSPVDTHIQRISERLGLITKLDNRRVHQEPDKIIHLG